MTETVKYDLEAITKKHYFFLLSLLFDHKK